MLTKPKNFKKSVKSVKSINQEGSLKEKKGRMKMIKELKLFAVLWETYLNLIFKI